MASSFFIMIYLLAFIFQSSANFNCVDVTSGQSGSGDDNSNSIACPSSYPTMTSCGFYQVHNSVNRDGGYISGGRCYAQNGIYGYGVRAKARCCKFPSSMTCVDRSGVVSGDDNTVQVSCPSGYNIFGCTAYCPWSDFDGSFFGTTRPDQRNWSKFYRAQQICTAQSSGSKTTGYARCCRSESQYTTECYMNYGQGSTFSIARCLHDFTMTGCSAWTWWDSQSRWYISDNECIAQSGDGSKVWASAVCCKMYFSEPPSSAVSIIGLSRSDDLKSSASGSILTMLVFLVLATLVITNLLCCIYKIKKMCYSTSKSISYEKVLTGSNTEIDESSADEMQKLKGYQI